MVELSSITLVIISFMGKKNYSVQEDDIGAYINVGRTYNHLNMYKEAEEAYLKVRACKFFSHLNKNFDQLHTICTSSSYMQR